MKPKTTFRTTLKTLLLPALALLLAGCATPQPAGDATSAKPTAAKAADPASRALQLAQADLDKLRKQPDLAALVPQEIADADEALHVAQNPSSDPVLAAHQRYMGEKRAQLARARAEEREAVNRLQALAGSSGDERLAAAANTVLPAPELSPPPMLPKPPKPAAVPAPSPAASTPTPSIDEPAPVATPAVPMEPAVASIPPKPAPALPPPTPLPEPAAAPPAPEVPLPMPASAPVVENATNVAATLPESAFTADGSALTAAGKAVLDELAASTKASGASIEVDGFSGDRGDNDQSLSLAQRRAETVKRALVGLGVDSTKISASGMGEYFAAGAPVEPRSPRVEVRIQ